MTAPDHNGLTSDLTIIGTGMAGMAAAVFAANRRIKTLLVGNTGASGFASGLFDLLGIYPLNPAQIRMDPWAGIRSWSAKIQTTPMRAFPPDP